jgi:hypothetical protein
MSKVNLNSLDIEELRELELDGKIENEKFQKIVKRKKFDDGTSATKTGRKKEKVQRGGKDEILETDDDE